VKHDGKKPDRYKSLTLFETPWNGANSIHVTLCAEVFNV